MPQDRNLLLMSMALQSAMSFTFGLVFFGLWKGFQRATALTWACAWVTYAFGVVFVVVGLGSGFPVESTPLTRAAVVMPLHIGIILFRSGADALIEQAPFKAWRYVTATLVVFSAFYILRVTEAEGWVQLGAGFSGYGAPRVSMGLLFAWAAWPLRNAMRRRWAEGFPLMVLALAGLSLRMFASAAYEFWQDAHGLANQPESLLLTILQVTLLVIFGVATALVLVEAERLEAHRATEEIRRGADALRASEERFRFVVEHTSNLQVIMDADLRIRYVAPNVERMLGRTPASFEGQQWGAIVNPDEREIVQKALARMHADPEGRRPATPITLQHASGEWMPFEVSGQLVMQDPPARSTIVLSIRDMKQQRLLEEALRQTQRLDSLGRMAGNVSHDFNNTLMAITAGLDLLGDQLKTDHPAQRPLEVVRKAAARGSSLTRQLLTFARQMPATSETFDINARLAAMDDVVKMAVGRGVVVELEPAPRTVAVKADAGQFDQVILNLAINARDAMPEGGRLTIAAQLSHANDYGEAEPALPAPFVRVGVKDTGTGIPPTIVHRIFDPFFTTKLDGKGTGLGLASAYGFARQAGGRLTVVTEEGKGTEFFLDLPLAS